MKEKEPKRLLLKRALREEIILMHNGTKIIIRVVKICDDGRVRYEILAPIEVKISKAQSKHSVRKDMNNKGVA